jgi:hypothetical protein
VLLKQRLIRQSVRKTNLQFFIKRRDVSGEGQTLQGLGSLNISVIGRMVFAGIHTRSRGAAVGRAEFLPVKSPFHAWWHSPAYRRKSDVSNSPEHLRLTEAVAPQPTKPQPHAGCDRWHRVSIERVPQTTRTGDRKRFSLLRDVGRVGRQPGCLGNH